MGSEMALTYFEKYGWQDIDTFFTYSSAALGTTIFSELFSGKVQIDLASINRMRRRKMTEQLTRKPRRCCLPRWNSGSSSVRSASRRNCPIC